MIFVEEVAVVTQEEELAVKGEAVKGEAATEVVHAVATEVAHAVTTEVVHAVATEDAVVEGLR